MYTTRDEYNYERLKSSRLKGLPFVKGSHYIRYEDGEVVLIGRTQLLKNDFDRFPKLYGIGTDDLPEDQSHFKDKWRGMLCRVVTEERGYKLSRDCIGLYAGVGICEEWLTYSNFKCWVETQPYEGNDLDKDLFGARTYGPDTSYFLPHQLNCILQTNRTGKLGILGVTKKKLKYVTNGWWMEKPQKRYSFSCPYEAHRQWQLTKAENLKRAAELYYDQGRICIKSKNRIIYLADKILADREQNILTTSIL